MKDETRGESRRLREQLSNLSKASLRISDSLDFDTVLREVLEGARELTGARTALITTLTGSGQIQEHVGRGYTRAERQWLREMPLGPRFREYMVGVASRPARIKDLRAQLCSLGFPDDPMVLPTFLGSPIRYQAVRLGSFYLGDKQTGPEFTREDEEILTLFSHQAGAAIANARKHRDEQRARGDLEALIDISPVAVLVFDAETGKIKLLNAEAQRMANALHQEGKSMQEMLSTLSLCRADGQAVEWDDLLHALREARPARAQEIVLRGPDGASLTTFVNVAPIRSESDVLESVLVTLQDMTPREELERLRAEFMGLVSHELRAPLTSIKGCTASALGVSPVSDPAEIQQYFRIIDEQADHMRALISDLLDVARIESGTLSVDPRSEDLAVIVDQARSTFLSGGARNPVRIDLSPDLPRVMADRQRIVQVLGNLLANAAQHSRESSPIRLTAWLEEVWVAISVSDEGKGIAPERLQHLFRKFARSGREEPAQRVGAGLGLAICRGLVEAHGGRIWAESEGENRGARLTFELPVAGETETDGIMRYREPQPHRRHPGATRPRILVVDDDPQALAHVRPILERGGYRALVTGDATEVEDLVRKERPHLVLLDLVLQGTDGIELMRGILTLADLPVIFLSVYSRHETIAKALEGGAVDYIVKPFSPTELLARIGVALRSQAATAEPYRAGDLAIDYEHRRVEIAGGTVALTATEYNLLRALAENAGRVSTYDYLLRRVWGWDNRGDTRTVRAFIRNLRRKLGDDAREPRYIFTEPRVGYRMAERERGCGPCIERSDFTETPRFAGT